jgi:hypothetical protein
MRSWGLCMKTLWRDGFNCGRVELRSILSEGELSSVKGDGTEAENR